MSGTRGVLEHTALPPQRPGQGRPTPRRRRQAPKPSELVVGAVALSAAATLGVVAGGGSYMAPLVAGVLAAGWLVLASPFAGLLLLVALIPLEAVIVVGGLTITRLVGLGVFGAWALRRLVMREPWRPLWSSRYFPVASVLVVIALASTFWAEYPRDVRSGVIQLVQLFALSLLVIDLVSSWDRLAALIKVLILGALVAASLTLMQFTVGGVRRAGEDVAGGINDTAIVLVTVLPFVFYLLRAERNRLWGVVTTAYIAIGVAAVAVTFSRMNFMLLPLVLLTQVWHLLRGRRGRGWLVALAAAAVVAGVWLVPWQRVATRAQLIGPELAAFVGLTSEGFGAGSGRGFHIRASIEIFKDHPLLGVGYGNFGRHFLNDYQFRLSGAHKIWTSPRSPHSSHGAFLAELGVLGTAVWLLLLGVAFTYLWSAWRRLARARGSPHFSLVQATMYAFLLQAGAYTVYAPIHREKLFWLLLGASVVAWRLSAGPATAAER